MPRSRLGPLAIESKLGDHPSTSSVWRAVHVQHKKSVAVKVFSAPFGGTPEARKLFADEWERLKQLSHPGLAKCFGGGFEETDAYLAYELIEGETLASQIERMGRLSWENTLEIAQGLADAIECLHGNGIVHGSISPDKIIVSGFAPVLLDPRTDRFGSPFRSSRPPSIEQAARQAPELVTSGITTSPGQCSPASDLYAAVDSYTWMGRRGLLLPLGLSAVSPLSSSGFASSDLEGGAAVDAPSAAGWLYA